VWFHSPHDRSGTQSLWSNMGFTLEASRDRAEVSAFDRRAHSNGYPVTCAELPVAFVLLIVSWLQLWLRRSTQFPHGLQNGLSKMKLNAGKVWDMMIKALEVPQEPPSNWDEVQKYQALPPLWRQVASSPWKAVSAPFSRHTNPPQT
jgi:hypothetical protein